VNIIKIYGMKVFIGIDPGVDTGVAVWQKSPGDNRFTYIQTMAIHKALDCVRTMHLANQSLTPAKFGLTVILEDARKRGSAPGVSAIKAQGAGSVKRDSKIWEDALKDWGIPYVLVQPAKRKNKITQEQFERQTGWKGRTSNHARDAAMLVFGR
jgi:hypothetical protein